MTPADLKRVASELAPELGAGLPFYVSDFPRAGCALDYWATNDFDIDDWRGGGSIVLLDLADLAARARPGAEEAVQTAAIIHECAHILPRPSGPTLAATRRRRDGYDPAAVGPAIREDVGKTAKPIVELLSHGPDFIRRCVHLYVRALARGYTVFAGDVLMYEWLTPLSGYFEPLLGGAIRMQSAPFSEINAMPIDAQTMKTFTSDRLRFDFLNARRLAKSNSYRSRSTRARSTPRTSAVSWTSTP